MPPTIGELFSSPDHYLHSFQDDAAVFLPMDREAYNRSIFLDQRISPAAETVMQVPASAFTDRVPPPAQTAWIFHVAHCGSTLLARALDRATANLVLREPLALRQLALDPDPRRLEVVAAMLSKRYQADRPTVVKANVPVNFLLPQLVRLDPQARAIILYLGLRDYLLAILRNDRQRARLKRLTDQLAPYLGDLTGMSDAERAAALWAAQVGNFEIATASLPNARTLDAESFFAEPGRCLKLAAAHLCVPMGDDEADSIVAGPLFATYSKDPRLPFNNEIRLMRKSEIERTLAPELERAERWIEERGGQEDALRAIAAAALDGNAG